MSKIATKRRKKRRNDGKRLERLTAALHALKMRGADVRWDERINGYQVDVTVRFKNGWYDFLMIIECRDRTRPSSRDDVVLLENRRKATNADKAVLVNALGFQSGAQEVARDHNIGLFTLQEIPADWPETVTASLPAHLGVRRIWIRSDPGGLRGVAPEHCARLLSLGRISSQSGKTIAFNDAFQPYLPPDWRALTTPFQVRVAFEGAWALTVDGLPDLPIAELAVELEAGPAGRTIVAKQPPEQRPNDIVYRDAQKADTTVIPSQQVPFGLNAEVEGGQFYRDIHGREYFFESVGSENVVAVLLASVQHGGPFFARVVMAIELARMHYAKIDSARDIDRLRRALAVWRDAESRGQTSVGGFLQNLEDGSIYLPPGFRS